MPVSIPRLRTWFGALAVLTVLVVAGFYFYAKIQVHYALKEVPKKLGVDIQQSSEGFSLSKSEGGRTLFTIRASKVVQYKTGGIASLNDVKIIVYGRDASRFDQISGSGFEYDPQAGTVSTKGEVQIDLQGNSEGLLAPDQSIPRELKNPIHLKTSALTFNQKTGLAHTDATIEFRVPQASGQATGATYDSKTNTLTLESQVNVTAGGDHPTTLHAARGKVTKDPRQILLETAELTQPERRVAAHHIQILLTDDNDISSLVATGDVQLDDKGSSGLSVRAPKADLAMGAKSTLRSVAFSGGVHFAGRASGAIDGNSNLLTMDFAGTNQLQRVVARDNVYLRQSPQTTAKNQQMTELHTGQLTLMVAGGNRLTSGDTAGPGEITLTSQQPRTAGERTLISAQRLHAEFDSTGRIKLLRGEPGAKIVSIAPGAPNKVSTSRSLLVHFAPGGGLADIVQEDGVRYTEAQSASGSRELGGRRGSAERVRYSPDDDTLLLTGSPRFIDGGMTIAAEEIRINRRSGDAFAQGAVKTTYSELRQEPNGALLATSDPVHVTARAVLAQRLTGVARYTGGARLWQAANAVEAPTIEFNRVKRSIVAEGGGGRPVTSVFVQVDKQGHSTPMVVNAAHLAYVDAERRARYTGGVRAKGNGLTITADHADVVLQAAKSGQSGPSQLDQIIAQQNITIQQTDRRATGERLVYTSASGTFVLTGGPPLLADAEHGTIRGDSLTFYSRDDRVVVESNGTSRTVTRTRVAR